VDVARKYRTGGTSSQTGSCSVKDGLTITRYRFAALCKQRRRSLRAEIDALLGFFHSDSGMENANNVAEVVDAKCGLPFGFARERNRFAMDSPLEGAGFEPSVPRDSDDGFRSNSPA
jgi:hypothetical protein